ncbi:Arc family DNA-binding protein [Paraburkholderia hospita]|uniref:Arc family DNA-binding protein n=1 Tax=Paraburkholderia hospita TaxID=169430 RepID=UPI000B3434FD|nr:Arc family DNA-binding protein [Paraburkholderia hospita]OUL79966.1 hypothetical protein CA603_32750 [Paraburkholderia hospita]
MDKETPVRSHQTGDKYIVRFPDGMRERIADAAKASGRSMNLEIVKRLQDSFDGTSGTVNTEELLEGLLPEWLLKTMKEGAAKRKIPLFAEMLLRLEMFDEFMASKEARDGLAEWAQKAVVKSMTVEEFARMKDQMQATPEKKPASPRSRKRKLDVD